MVKLHWKVFVKTILRLIIIAIGCFFIYHSIDIMNSFEWNSNLSSVNNQNIMETIKLATYFLSGSIFIVGGVI